MSDDESQDFAIVICDEIETSFKQLLNSLDQINNMFSNELSRLDALHLLKKWRLSMDELKNKYGSNKYINEDITNMVNKSMNLTNILEACYSIYDL